MGDSTLVEFLRDIAIIAASLALALWLLVMGIIAIVVVKKLNAVISAVRHAASSVQEGGQALKDSLGGKNPFLGIAAAGVGKAIGAMFRGAFKR